MVALKPNNLRLTTVAACRVVNMDRQRLNESIAAGDYAIAPHTVPGRSRQFALNDLIPLFIFARLVEQDWKPQRAGRLARSAFVALAANPEADELMMAQPFVPADPRNVHLKSVANSTVAGADVFYALTFNVSRIRSIILERIENELIGEPDPE